MALTISSAAFSHQNDIPVQYTCDGRDESPPLAWSGVPEGARSLVLIVSDPDAPDPAAPRMTWTHWLLYNLPPECPGLERSITRQALPPGTLEGLNDWRRTGYGGPCPPVGRHRYFFKLFALNTILPDLGKPTRAKLEEALKGHIIEQAELIGTYQR